MSRRKGKRGCGGENMECDVCGMMTQIDGFGGYLHYTSTRNNLDALVREGTFERWEPNSVEVCYRCKRCHTVWGLAEPDFPVTGYLLRKEGA